MNITNNGTYDKPICETCLTSHGFTAADRRAIILTVILTCIALALCYAGVLWFSIRARTVSQVRIELKTDNIHRNNAFNDEQVDQTDFVSLSPQVQSIESI
jgi:hypothetical protein